MGLSVWHVLVVLLIVLILFGAGRLPQVMGDLAKGIKTFKAGLKDEEGGEKPPSDTAAKSQPAPGPDTNKGAKA